MHRMLLDRQVYQSTKIISIKQTILREVKDVPGRSQTTWTTPFWR